MARRAKNAFASDPVTHDLVVAKLASSGLTEATGVAMHVKGYSAAETQACHTTFKAVRSLVLPYHDPLGEPLSDWPNGQPFYRLRYLEAANDFSAQTKKPIRYVQPPNTAPVAYYPTNQDWSTIVDDVEQPVILTEGELKAAKACQEGFPTIGIGGVYSWRAHKLGMEFLPSLEYVTWLRRNVYICYDSDMRYNPNVQEALRELAEALYQRGAFVLLVTVPPTENGDKVGLDDFFVAHGKGGVSEFRRLLHEAEPLGLARVLFSFNKRYVYVRIPGLIMDQVTDQKIAPTPFKEHVESVKQYQERRLTKDGSISYQPVSAAAAWLTWPLRHYVDRLTYAPGEAREIHEAQTCSYNIWPGWGVEPKEGDVSPFLKLIDHLFADAEPAAKAWFLQWCAYPLQYPGTKLFSSAVMHGTRHGTGKSLIGYTLGRIYGKNFVEITQQDLHGSFNEWAEAKQFVLGDDVTGSNKRQEGDVLKKLITQREIRVNGKYVPTYVVPDCINYYFTSNHPDAFFLEDDDRRFFIHEVSTPPLPEIFYAEYDLWLDTGGSSAVFDYLMKLDVSDFNPAATALRTSAKERMIADGQSDLGAWVRMLCKNPDHLLRVGDISLCKDLYTNKELLNLYDPSGRTGTTANGLGRELRRAGVKQIRDGQTIKLPDGSQDRYYVVRDCAKWQNAQPAAIVAHLTGPSMPGPQLPKY